MTLRNVITFVAAAIALASGSAALACSGSAAASGGGVLGPDTITGVQVAGGNVILDGTSSGALTGTLDSAFTESFRDVVHADGSVDITATVALQGQTSCGAGSWTQALVVHVAPDGSFTGQTSTIDDAAATVPVSTEYSFSGAGNAFTYTGSYSCSPTVT